MMQDALLLALVVWLVARSTKRDPLDGVPIAFIPADEPLTDFDG